MSQTTEAVPSSLRKKRPYRKGSPMTAVERQQIHIAKRKETHKELRVYVENSLKHELELMCKQNGVTQSEMIESFIKIALMHDKNIVKD
ncbi:replication regulatory protein RepA [Yersinia ruckeri]|uniref:replication regulatory protein RepA n=1 Tax=Yersinia ruckeri TaxID=29486 RepID=UPI001F1B7E90|nr:replication regulatory protein RepA [Yersinia ruckeri]UIN02552.1 replication regulatory protein RepA [Yersinia ruckeri]